MNNEEIAENLIRIFNRAIIDGSAQFGGQDYCSIMVGKVAFKYRVKDNSNWWVRQSKLRVHVVGKFSLEWNVGVHRFGYTDARLETRGDTKYSILLYNGNTRADIEEFFLITELIRI